MIINSSLYQECPLFSRSRHSITKVYNLGLTPTPASSSPLALPTIAYAKRPKPGGPGLSNC